MPCGTIPLAQKAYKSAKGEAIFSLAEREKQRSKCHWWLAVSVRETNQRREEDRERERREKVFQPVLSLAFLFNFNDQVHGDSDKVFLLYIYKGKP